MNYIYDSEIFIDLYEILDLDIETSQEEIKSAYVKLVKKNHPDQGGSSEQFQKITRAYEILYNKEIRKEYDLYYLKKNTEELKGDDMIRLKKEFNEFMETNKKSITEEELDILYKEAFKDEEEKPKMDKQETDNMINNMLLERETMNIETQNDALKNFIEENNLKINDIFEYMSYNNSGFDKNIITKDYGTLDISNNYSSFESDNDFFNSNLYTNLTEINTISEDSINNIDINELKKWKTNIKSDAKISDNDMEEFLKQRQLEQLQIEDEIKHHLINPSKEEKKFLKTHNLLEQSDEKNTNTTINNIRKREYKN